MRRVRVGVAIVGAVVAAACSNTSYGTGPGGGGGHSTTITVANNSFSPTPDSVAAGTVTFSWANGAVTHNVTWLSGPSAPTGSGDKSSGTYQATLVAGTYTYECSIHASLGMTGTIVVH
jgi:plastocyanin